MLLFEPRFVSLSLVKENTPNFKIPKITISASSEDLVCFHRKKIILLVREHRHDLKTRQLNIKLLRRC